MSLDWELKDIKDWNYVTTHPDDREKLKADPKATVRWNPVSQALIQLTLPCAYGVITRENWRDVYLRIHQYERSIGASIQYESGPQYITPEDVYAHIGLRTNNTHNKMVTLQAHLLTLLRREFEDTFRNLDGKD